MLVSTVVDRGFDPGSGHGKDYEIGICCFSAKHKHAALRRKSKAWLAQNQDNNYVRVGRHVYLRTVVLVIRHYTNPSKHVGLVQSIPHHHPFEN